MGECEQLLPSPLPGGLLAAGPKWTASVTPVGRETAAAPSGSPAPCAPREATGPGHSTTPCAPDAAAPDHGPVPWRPQEASAPDHRPAPCGPQEASAPDRIPVPWRPEEDEPWGPGEDEPWGPGEGEFSAPERGEPQDPGSWVGPWRPLFSQGAAADVLPPGPCLAALTEAAVPDLARLTDNELMGVLQATRRQVAREQFKQVLVTAEFARRRQDAFEDAARRGLPVGCRPGGFPGEELAIELVTTRAEAGHRIDDALDLTSRLPRTLAGMAAGLIDQERAGWIALYTRSLTDEDAARADAVLAEAAPDLCPEQVARKAAALEKKLAPEAVRARREHARRSGQRVEARRELSGNASLSGREMDTVDVLASKAYLDAMAARLRRGGLVGPLGSLRVLALADLTQGRNPLDRLSYANGSTPQLPAPVAPQPAPATWPDWDTSSTDDAGETGETGNASETGEFFAGEPGEPRGDDPGSGTPSDPVPGVAAPDDSVDVPPAPAPVPAQINLIIPIGTLLGWSTGPAQAGPWGLLDHDETRTVAAATARHPLTRWCATLTGLDGTALAHACAAGQHPALLTGLPPQPPPARLAELLRSLNLTFTPVARGSCDHVQGEDHYTPSRKLKHLVRARTATCDAPGCQAQALSTDLDHTVPWPEGPTDQSNLAPRCRTHHRAKQAPDWNVEQAAPGVTRWSLPSGRTYTTTPTSYET